MSFDATSLTTLGISTSSISALALSIYNWFKSRVGARIKIVESYRFGIFTYQSGRKHIYLPLDVMNYGSSIGMINSVEFEIQLSSGKKVKFRPTRRVEVSSMSSSKSITQNDLKDILPTLPVFCPPSEGVSAMFEYYEDSKDDDIVQTNVDYKCKLSIRYDGNKSEVRSFSLQMSDEAWAGSGHSIYWIDLN